MPQTTGTGCRMVIEDGGRGATGRIAPSAGVGPPDSERRRQVRGHRMASTGLPDSERDGERGAAGRRVPTADAVPPDGEHGRQARGHQTAGAGTRDGERERWVREHGTASANDGTRQARGREEHETGTWVEETWDEGMKSGSGRPKITSGGGSIPI